MSSQDWEHFGDEIRRTVKDAVENRNYEKLNQMISDTVNQAVDSAARNLKTQSKHSKQPQHDGSQIQYTNQPKRKQELITFQMRMPSKVGPILRSVLGYTFGTITFILFLCFLIVGNLAVRFALGFQIASWIFLVAAIVCIFTGITGTNSLLRISRFQTYVKTIGKREYCNISELAGQVGKPNEFVVKDVEKMLKSRWFCQGHLDSRKTCLMVTDRMYAEYQQLVQRREQEEKEALEEESRRKKEQDSRNAYRKELSPEVRKVIEQGDEYLRKIHECNDAISGEEISEKISRIEILVDRIFDRVEENPGYVSDIRKFMEYYLPTTVKLLDAYAEMDVQPVGGENIRTAKREIEATLDTLNVAFEKLLDSLFQDTAWDLSSDISVLNTMLAQEGLKEDGLKK
ncbi:MAG: 5-bromo-4-chloroindolyl phosphate hydrolysis family protein [Lachnospiraceae bacterium]